MDKKDRDCHLILLVVLLSIILFFGVGWFSYHVYLYEINVKTNVTLIGTSVVVINGQIKSYAAKQMFYQVMYDGDITPLIMLNYNQNLFEIKLINLTSNRLYKYRTVILANGYYYMLSEGYFVTVSEPLIMFDRLIVYNADKATLYGSIENYGSPWLTYYGLLIWAQENRKLLPMKMVNQYGKTNVTIDMFNLDRFVPYVINIVVCEKYSDKCYYGKEHKFNIYRPLKLKHF